MKNALASFFDTRFMTRLVANPRGRAFILSLMAEAEEADEAGVFDALLERVDDPTLHKMVRRHVDDEARHAKLLRERVRAVGVAPPPVPRALSVVDRINRALGNLGEGFVENQRSVMEAYVLLEVVEERAVEQFPRIAAALDAVDPVSAEVVREIWKDEKRHVLYARAIGEKYAPDAETLAKTRSKFRVVEQRAFDENGGDVLRYALEQNLLELPFVERLMWRAMAAAA